MKTVVLHTEEDTRALAREIAAQLHGGEVIALNGDLGSGKTTFTQYLAQELGVTQHVNSPTFVIMKQYHAYKPPIHTLVHVDAYRLTSADELDQIGIDQHIGKAHAVVVIEWAEKVREALEKVTLVKITFTSNTTGRSAHIDYQAV